MSSACGQCARRAWLLERLNVALDFRARDLARFWRLLELSDDELIDAIGGRRRGELREDYKRWKPSDAAAHHALSTTCVHRSSYPRSLRGNALAPRALGVREGVERLESILEGGIVAIVGTRRASDYGMETARELSRGLAASGVTVSSGFGEGIAAAVHTGALEAGGQTLAVVAGGLERCSPAWCRGLYRRILQDGCAISELLDGDGPRSRGWWQPARDRTLALLAGLVIVVEAREHPWELACARVAQMRGTPVAAVPGRVTSTASTGSNSLLMEGARLVRGPRDALDALYGVAAREPPGAAGDTASAATEIGPRLARVLALVGNGRDTPAKLAADLKDSGAIALALIELELAGLVVRGDGGRYLPSARAAAA
ncbi:MAG TPA: DNA-processing protein DprA [Solirubrobacteraceae bacterium]|jgi:DNA processing protein